MACNFPTVVRRTASAAAAAALCLTALDAAAQDPARGAALYMRVVPDTRSCLSCHGHDPSANPNNILKGADNNEAVVKALNTVSAMGYLRSYLSDRDTRDLAAYLGSVARSADPAGPLAIWPITFEFGSVAVGSPSAVQTLHIENRSSQAVGMTGVGTTNPAFAVAHNCPTALPPGSRCQAEAWLKEAPAGAHHGAMVVRDAGGTAAVVGLLADGHLAPVSRIEWEGGVNTLSFPPAAAGVAQTRTLAIRNLGTMPVTLGVTTVTGPAAHLFERTQGCDAGTVLQAGTSCQMLWRYTASPLPTARATAQVRADGTHPASLDLLGEGTPARADPQLAIQPPTGGGGGCSIGPPSARHFDPLLLLLAALAGLIALGRRAAPPPR